MKIADREIGIDKPTYFIAEIGSNFDGDFERSKELIWLAKEVGADAAKFQHYTAETLVSDFGFCQLENQSHQAAWKKSVFDTYRDAELNYDWTARLAEEAKKAGIHFFTSPYSYFLADYVEPFVCAFKVGSGEITWVDYVRHLAEKRKPIILATGASNQAEVDRAVSEVLAVNPSLVVMQCNTNYTADASNAGFLNLSVLASFAERYPGVTLGLSDHTTTVTSVVAAISLGARVIEKHFTDNSMRAGPDHPFSTGPNEWRAMISAAREVELMLGDGHKRVEANEETARIVQRRAIRARRELSAGDLLSEDDLEFLRPCAAEDLSPTQAPEVLGKRLRVPIRQGQAVRLCDLK